MYGKPARTSNDPAARCAWTSGAAVAALLTACTIVYAQQQAADVGKAEYLTSCAGCHGADGKGNELTAAQLNKPMPDLTRLRKENGGSFPLSRLYNVIDGRESVAAHGARDMPVWGSAFATRVAQLAGGAAAVKESESYTWRRILALIWYISTIQSK